MPDDTDGSAPGNPHAPRAPGVSLRSAGPGDVEAVLGFWRTAAENAARPADDRAAVEALLDRDPLALTLAEVDGRVVGTLVAGWDGWRCHLYRLAVAPEQRRRGVGRLLVRAAEERFTALGARRVDAMVLDSNDDAHSTWRALGYAPQQEWSRWVKPLGPAG